MLQQNIEQMRNESLQQNLKEGNIKAATKGEGKNRKMLRRGK